MAAFEYLALDPSGRQQKGVLEADSARQVRQLLRERQLAPLDVKPGGVVGILARDKRGSEWL
ncbi:hypothetical protein HKW91_40640, partial [Pseudomonas aeruginosa]|nr:hypothetical protein [Pseudomonas aeruginosa]